MIENELKSLANEKQRCVLMKFFKTGAGEYGEGDCFLGVKVPQTRAIVKKYGDDCSETEMISLICSPYHEVRLCGLLILCRKFHHAKRDVSLQQHFVEIYLEHIPFINNWDLVDLSCYDLLGTWLLDKDRSILYEMAKPGRTLWEQRIAIVSTMQFIRHGELDDTFAIAGMLCHHPHNLIHKAVGWLLREAGKHDQSRLEAFLIPQYHSLPRTLLRYAIERFPENVRKEYLSGNK